MEDEKLKTLFTDFDPELPPDTRFMSRLRRNMESVELVKQQNARAFAINKRAVSLALAVGFIVGFLSSRLMPYLTAVISQWQQSLPDDTLLNALTGYLPLVVWIIIGGTSALAALTAYDLTLTTSRPRR